MRAQVQDIADELLDAALAEGRVDLLAAYATPLPLVAISRVLGVPDADADRFHGWWQTFLTASNGGSPARVVPALWQMVRCMRRLVRERTIEPREDLVSALVRATEVDDALSEDEVLAMIFVLLSAGHETTVNLIGSGLLALLEHPDELERFRDDPTVAGTGTEELLRYVAPVDTATERYPCEDVEVAGVVNRARRADARGAGLGQPATPTCSSSPTRWTCAAARTRTCRSGRASTTASVLRWHAWRGRSGSARCCVGRRTSRSPYRVTSCDGAAASVVRGLEALPVDLVRGR